MHKVFPFPWIRIQPLLWIEFPPFPTSESVPPLLEWWGSTRVEARESRGNESVKPPILWRGEGAFTEKPLIIH